MNARRLASTILALLAAAGPARATEAPEPREGAWDRSLALESGGRIEEARRILLSAWGAESESYEVTVRIAWLSLRLEELERAAWAYERARGLAGAGPEATEGLCSTLTGLGYRHLDRWEWSEARRQWESVLALCPDRAEARRGLDLLTTRHHLSPEAWGAYLYRSGGGARSHGFAVFALLPWHVTRELTVRAAYRHVEVATVGSTADRFRQHEVYLAAAYEHRWVGGEILGATLLPSVEGAAFLGGARLRVGRSFGVAVEGAVLHRDSGWSGQVLPTAFWYPVPAFGLAGGVRLTRDTAGTSPSGYAAFVLNAGPVRLDLAGHVGAERWPLTLSVPLVLSSLDELRLGGTLSAWFALSEAWSLGLGTQVEQLGLLTGGEGLYLSAAAGIRFSPSF